MTQAGLFKRYQQQIFGLGLGALFGFLMSRAGATTYDYHAQMFLLQDLQLMEVIMTAVIIAMAGVWLLRKFQVHAITTHEPVDFVKKPYQKGLMAGAFLFGIGWAMTASCPGTIPAMIGEGKIGALFAFVGLIMGTMAYGVLQSYLTLEKQQSPLD